MAHMHGTRLACCSAVAWAVLALSGCSPSGASEPSSTFTTLVLSYEPPPVGTPPPAGPDLAMCYHHYAPSHLMLRTSWGFTARLAPVDDRRVGMAVFAVPTGQDHWVAFMDISLCPTGSPAVTRGVTVNGVALTRTVTPGDGGVALAFHVDVSGRVIP